MGGNQLGSVFRITSFGESHGAAIGVVIDGCPAGLVVRRDVIQKALDRRAPGRSAITSSRKEKDIVEILSGVSNDVSLGTPICLMVRNQDARSEDYKNIRNIYRPSHADYVYDAKYGVRDYRGGGRASARETVARVAAGAVAGILLDRLGIKIYAYVDQIYKLKSKVPYDQMDINKSIPNALNIPDDTLYDKVTKLIQVAKEEGDSLGGSICCIIRNCPVGLGEPVFDKLHADLAKAMMSIPASRGFEIGSGFGAILMKGSEHNDSFYTDDHQKIKTKTNHSGGIQGGISNGMDINFRVAFKPVSTIAKEQTSVNTLGQSVAFKNIGRHDPCVVPRAIPIVEAMTKLVLADHYLRNKTSTILHA